MLQRVFETVGAVALCCTALLAQNQGKKLALMLPSLYSTNGEGGFTLPNETHHAHFSESFESTVYPLDSSIARQISLLPIASPASGFHYIFDTGLGAPTRSAESLGPILTERAETIGRRRFYMALTYQYFSFDKLDGVDLKSVPAVFRHEATTSPFGSDYISTSTSIDLKVNQFTVFGTFGLTDRLDVSVAVPLMNVHLGAVSSARIVRLYTPPPGTPQPHYFDPSDPENSTTKLYAANSTASGIGDVTFRGKWTVQRFGEHGGFALAADVRTPTGDAYNLLGSGTPGIRPFAALSFYTRRFAPHFNLGYQWNGSSVLAGNNILNGDRGHLPNSLTYAAGADIGATRRVTFAFDVLADRIFKGTRVSRITGTDALAQTYQDVQVRRSSYNMANGAVGVKINLGRTLLLTGNVIFRLNDAGLRANVVPLIGLSYSL
jgi:hypothetical protein